ncbi:MAG: hypothetical protein IKA05_05500 [Clostridia bacterium]|nr:hypothetical protein [Clostridia bacterium]
MQKNGANAKKAGFLHAASFLYESLHESVRLFVKSAEKAKKDPQALAFPAVAVYNIMGKIRMAKVFPFFVGHGKNGALPERARPPSESAKQGVQE